MTDPSEQDVLVKEIRLRSDRQKGWLDDNSSITGRLAQIGILGWMIVLPMLIGIFAGRWLDHKFNSGLFCTAPLLMAGLALGCWSAWKWIKSA